MRIFQLILVCFVLTACNSWNAPAVAQESNEIKIYDVSEGHADELFSVLHNMLRQPTDDAPPLGRISRMSDSQLVIITTETLHSNIQRIIQQVSELPPLQRDRVRLSYWLVHASKDLDNSLPEPLNPIANALDQTGIVLQGYGFESLDFVQHVVVSGEDSQVSGGNLRGNARVLVKDQRIALELSLSAIQLDGAMNTNIDLLDGETIVLAQVGSQDESKDNLLFVVKAETF